MVRTLTARDIRICVGRRLTTLTATVKAYSTFQLHVVHDDDGAGTNADEDGEVLLFNTITTETFVGTFKRPIGDQSALGNPRAYQETREISLRYEPVDRYRAVSKVLMRTSIRQWLDRMFALPSQVREYRTEYRPENDAAAVQPDAPTEEVKDGSEGADEAHEESRVLVSSPMARQTVRDMISSSGCPRTRQRC